MSGHWYTREGELVEAGEGYPSPTTILGIRHNAGLQGWRDRVGAEEADRIKDERGARGTRVHEAIEFYIKDGFGDVVAVYCEDDIEYMRGLLNWVIDYEPYNCLTEVFVLSDNHEYAGTTDLICWLTDADGNSWQYIVDFKTGKHVDDTFGLQLAAYENAWSEMGNGYSRRAVLQLVPELARGYRWREFTAGVDLPMFLAHKTIFDWLQSFKKTERKVEAWTG